MNLKGHKASPGYAIGKAFWLKKFVPILDDKIKLSKQNEIQIFTDALKRSQTDLELLQNGAAKESFEILDAHLMLLNDPEVIDKTIDYIESKNISAAKAYYDVIEEFKSFFASLEDDYIKQRVLDLNDISNRVLFYIEKPNDFYASIKVLEPSILVTDDLTPSEILSLDKTKILAFVTSAGASNSHTAILARSLEIPALVGVGDSLKNIKSGQKILLDSVVGTLSYDISVTDESLFLKNKAEFEKNNLELRKFKGQMSQTKDHIQIMLSANISGPQDLSTF